MITLLDNGPFVLEAGVAPGGSDKLLALNFYGTVRPPWAKQEDRRLRGQHFLTPEAATKLGELLLHHARE